MALEHYTEGMKIGAEEMERKVANLRRLLRRGL